MNTIDNGAKLNMSIYIREKYLCKNFGVKEGGGRLFKGAYFRGPSVFACDSSRHFTSSELS